MSIRWWTWFFRKRKLLAAPATEVVKASETAPAIITEEPAVEAAARVVEVQPGPIAIEAVADTGPSSGQNGPVAELVPATVPLALPAPAYPDDWMRARALYFSSGAYSPGAHAERVLAPDLVFRLGSDTRRPIAEARTLLVAQPPVSSNAAPSSRLMDLFSTSSEMEPKADPACLVNVDPLLLTLFFFGREGGPDVPEEATAEYLTQAPLPAYGVQLRDRVVQHWSSGGAPLGASELYALARQIVPHAGTALLICHNVAKAFARGGDAIEWQVMNRTRGEYSDGTNTYLAASRHREGVLQTGPFTNRSIFYVLFSSREFGTGDPGDYYRFFAGATGAWYAASGASRVPVVPPTAAARDFAQSFVDAATRLQDASVQLTPAYRGWLWGNLIDGRGAAFGLLEAADEGRPAVGAPAGFAVGPVRMSGKTIERIVETASAHIRRDFNGASFTLVCTVEEGMACRFATSDWGDRSLAGLARDIIDELGWRFVEQSSRRQVVIRCSGTECEYDRGGGFERFP